jgi:hypothetical protein
VGTQDGSVTARPRRAAWRPVRASFGSGLLSGICCVGGAIATAAGLGVAGFFGTLMDRYQLYFILAGVVVMVLWLARQLNRSGISPRDVRAAARLIGKHALVMGVVYAVTLGIAMGVARLVTT